MPFQKELLTRQCPVPGRERHPAFHGMLMAERLLGLTVGGSGQPCWQMQPPTLCSPITSARGIQLLQRGGHAGGLAAPRLWLYREGSRSLPPLPEVTVNQREVSGLYLDSGCHWLSPLHLCSHTLLASTPGAQGARPLCSLPALQPLGPRPPPRHGGALPLGPPAEVQAG